MILRHASVSNKKPVRRGVLSIELELQQYHFLLGAREILGLLGLSKA